MNNGCPTFYELASLNNHVGETMGKTGTLETIKQLRDAAKGKADEIGVRTVAIVVVRSGSLDDPNVRIWGNPRSGRGILSIRALHDTK